MRRKKLVITLSILLLIIGCFLTYIYLIPRRDADKTLASMNQEIKKLNEINNSKDATAIGYIEVNNSKIPFFTGDMNRSANNELLDKGAILEPFSVMPGKPGQTILGGHREDVFLFLKTFKNKEKIKLVFIKNKKTYTYEMYKSQIINAGNQEESKIWRQASRDSNDLVLYTCYPFTNNNDTSKRYFAFFKLVDTDEKKETQNAKVDNKVKKGQKSKMST